MKQLEWAVIQSDWCAFKNRKYRHKYTSYVHTQRRDHVRTQRDGGICKLRREASEGTKRAKTLTLDLQPQKLGGNTFLLFQPPHLWVFCYSSPSKLIQYRNIYTHMDEIQLTTWREVPKTHYVCYDADGLI